MNKRGDFEQVNGATLNATNEKLAIAILALEKISKSTCHEAQCWTLHKIASDALEDVKKHEYVLAVSQK